MNEHGKCLPDMIVDADITLCKQGNFGIISLYIHTKYRERGSRWDEREKVSKERSRFLVEAIDFDAASAPF